MTALLALVVGYGLRWLHDSYQWRQRSRALRALGGGLPDWETAARSLETHAHTQAMAGKYGHSRSMQREADRIRRRGLKRDRYWS